MLLGGAGQFASPRAIFLPRRFPPDARSRGMGSAFSAIAEGPWTVRWNPAALGLPHRNAVGFSVLREDSGPTYSLGATWMWRNVGFGVDGTYHLYDYDRLDSSGSLIDESKLRGGTGHLGFGFQVCRQGSPVRLGIGACLKVFKEGLVREKPNAAGQPGYRRYEINEKYHDLNLGAIIVTRFPLHGESSGTERLPAYIELRFGGVAENALHDGMSVSVEGDPYSVTGEVEAHNRFARAGLALEMAPAGGSGTRYPLKLMVAADWEESFDTQTGNAVEDGNTVNYFGGELTIREVVSLRAGTANAHMGEGWRTSFGCSVLIAGPPGAKENPCVVEISYANCEPVEDTIFRSGGRLQVISFRVDF